MKIALIDNYDSFTYNLVEYFYKLGVGQVDVFRNDEINSSDLVDYENIVLSPGPGLPTEAGVLMEVIRTYSTTKKILGICLGHQAIAECFGGSLENPNKVLHGVQTQAVRTSVNRGCMRDLPYEFTIGHYHSWNVSKSNLPDCFEVTCYDTNGTIMGIIHTEYNVEGIQFHPESVLTPLGLKMLENWINKQ